ncbi:MAG TPA: methyltransferase [bacterium]|nr:methyltransferase [bacterium]
MSTPADQVNDLIVAHWRSQTLHAGAALGVFDHLGAGETKDAETLAAELDVHSGLLYRLLRALASVGLLRENESGQFAITANGALLRSDHPQSLRDRALLNGGTEHYLIWRHLTDMIRDGRQNAFVREFGAPAFEYARSNDGYRRAFNRGMTSYSALQSAWTLEALQEYDFAGIRTICDVGGGHGHLLCELLKAHPHLTGIVLDLPTVVGHPDELLAAKLGLEHRCAYVAGDMFEAVPAADAYALKMILHDWNDDECMTILSNVRRAAPQSARVFIIEHVVPGPQTPHFAKLLDLHMMCWGTGRERTEEEYGELLRAAGWPFAASWYPTNRVIGVIEGR